MVKVLTVLFLFCTLSFAEIVGGEGQDSSTLIVPSDIAELVEPQKVLMEKIKTFVSPYSFAENEEFIKLIFSPVSSYYRQDRVNVVKVVQTLKENGLLNLLFAKPQELKLSFKTSTSPLFFVKIMGDTLRNIGYYRYVTTESNLGSSEFTWKIVLNAEYATDPLILQRELGKSGANIIDIVRNAHDDWEYSIDMVQSYLNVTKLVVDEEVTLRRSLYAHWLNIEAIKKLRIKSSFKDHWFPHISYYDKQLHLLKVIKKDRKTRTMVLKMPESAKYIKISDMYTLKNVREDLMLVPTGSR